MEKKIPTNPNSEDQNCWRTDGQLNLVYSSYGAETPREDIKIFSKNKDNPLRRLRIFASSHSYLSKIQNMLRPGVSLRQSFSHFRTTFPLGLNILYIKWNFVVRGSWFVVVVFYAPAVLHCSTDLLYMCSKQNTRRTTGTRRDTHHGHKKGAHPRASQGRALRC